MCRSFSEHSQVTRPKWSRLMPKTVCALKKSTPTTTNNNKENRVICNNIFYKQNQQKSHQINNQHNSKNLHFLYKFIIILYKIYRV